MRSNVKVFDPYVLMMTYVVWRNLDSVDLSTDIRPLIESTYLERKEQDAMESLRLLRAKNRKKMESEAERIKDVWSRNVRDDGVALTRYEQVPCTDVLLCRSISKHVDCVEIEFLSKPDPMRLPLAPEKPNREIAIRISENTVRAPFYLAKPWIETPSWAEPYFFGYATALVVAPDGSLFNADGRRIEGLVWNDRLGLRKNVGFPLDKNDNYGRVGYHEFDAWE